MEKENWLETAYRLLGLLGGGWLAIELLELFSKKVYVCPHCDYGIEEKQKGVRQCPNCQVNLKWLV